MGRKRAGNLVLDIDGTLIDSVSNGHLSGLSRVPDFISEWGDYIYFRPHLETFLLYAFSRFENVAIWTAASPEWYVQYTCDGHEPEDVTLRLHDASLSLVTKFASSCKAETILRALQPMLRRIRLQTNRKRTGSLDEQHQHRQTTTAGLARSSSVHGTSDTDDMFSFVFTKNRCAPKRVTDWQSRLVYEFHTKPLRKVWRSKSWKSMGWNSKNTLILEDTPQNCISNYGNALYIRTYNVAANRGRDSALLVLPIFLDRIRLVEDVRTIEKRDWERLCAPTIAPTLVVPPPLKHAKSSPAVLNPGLDNTESSASPDAQSRFTAFLTPRSDNSRFRSSESYDPEADDDGDDDDDDVEDSYDSASTTDSEADSCEADSSSDESYVSENDCSDFNDDKIDYADLISSRTGSLPITPYVHCMPTLKSVERLRLTTFQVAGVPARGKGDSEEIAV